MTTLEEQAADRVARKATHCELRLALDRTHTDVWHARDAVRAKFEEALGAYLAEPTSKGLEAVIAARARLDSFESLQTVVTSRRDAAFDAGEGL